MARPELTEGVVCACGATRASCLLDQLDYFRWCGRFMMITAWAT